MSVLIKGMQLPKCCTDCPCFYDYIACQALPDGGSVFDSGVMPIGFKMNKERLPQCPLVEVNEKIGG